VAKSDSLKYAWAKTKYKGAKAGSNNLFQIISSFTLILGGPMIADNVARDQITELPETVMEVSNTPLVDLAYKNLQSDVDELLRDNASLKKQKVARAEADVLGRHLKPYDQKITYSEYLLEQEKRHVLVKLLSDQNIGEDQFKTLQQKLVHQNLTSVSYRMGDRTRTIDIQNLRPEAFKDAQREVSRGPEGGNDMMYAAAVNYEMKALSDLSAYQHYPAMAAFMGGVLPGVFLALMFASPWWRRRMSAAANTPPRKAEFVKIKPNH
tara:strand:+ start:2276 stop:3073 length:798 start_codon:yes stop_codon:yes gene_type:complete